MPHTALAPSDQPTEALASYGIIVRNAAALPAPGAPRTAIVLGIQRGGTSMVAELLHTLGVYMGQQAASPTYEDGELAPPLRRYMREEASGDISSEVLERLIAIAAKRNKEHAVWGFKFPDVICPPLYKKLRNPLFISVHRDPVSICARLQKSDGADITQVMPAILALQQRQTEFLLSTPHPCLALSYEKALLNPQACVAQVAEFLGLAATAEQRAAAAEKIHPSPKAYLEGTRQVSTVGNLDCVKDGLVRGWAADTGNLGEKLTVRVLVDGVFCAEGQTAQTRPDVRKYIGAHYGETQREDFGFIIPIPAALRDGRPHVVTVEIAGATDYRIGASGLEYVLS